jgi:hypothetical protein
MAQVDDLGAHALQNAAHDVDGRVMPIKQAGGCDKAHFVLGTVVGQGLVFSGQIGHGVDGVNREKLKSVKGYWRVDRVFMLT